MLVGLVFQRVPTTNVTINLKSDSEVPDRDIDDLVIAFNLLAWPSLLCRSQIIFLDLLFVIGETSLHALHVFFRHRHHRCGYGLYA